NRFCNARCAMPESKQIGVGCGCGRPSTSPSASFWTDLALASGFRLEHVTREGFASARGQIQGECRDLGLAGETGLHRRFDGLRGDGVEADGTARHTPRVRAAD